MDIIIKYYQGFFTFSLFEYLLLSLIFTHITIISVTLYLHRCMAHKSIEINNLKLIKKTGGKSGAYSND